MHTYTQFTEVVYTGRTIPSDVWMTANPLNNTENTISVPFLTAVGKVDGCQRGKVRGNKEARSSETCDVILFVPLFFSIVDAAMCAVVVVLCLMNPLQCSSSP